MSYTSKLASAVSRVEEFVDEALKEEKRERKLTEKGLDYRINRLQRSQNTTIQRLKLQAEQLKASLCMECSLEDVQSARTTLDELYRNFVTNYDEYMKLCENPEEDSFKLVMDEVEEYVFQLKTEALDWIKLHQSDRKSTSSKSSSRNSKSSSHKSRSSTRSKLIDEKARLAVRKTEIEYTEKKRRAKEVIEKLEIEEEIAKAQARYKTFNEELSQMASKGEPTKYEIEVARTKPATKEQKKTIRKKADYELDREVQPPIDPVEDVCRKEPLDSQLLIQLINRHSAPAVEIDSFRGDPLEYTYFMAAFEESVERRIDDPRGRLTRLIQYTTGQPKELIKNCILIKTGDCYEAAKKLLYDKYGNPHILMASYRRELSKWPQLKAGDSLGYQNYVNFLFKLRNVLLHYESRLFDTPEMICQLMRKLPFPTQDSWTRRVHSMRKKGDYETLDDFI